MDRLTTLGGRIDRGPLTGALTSVALVALVTGAIALLDGRVAVLGLAVLYLFAVLPMAVIWGTWPGVGTAVLAMLAFNFFFLPPLHTLRLSDTGNWVVLAVFALTAVVVSELAARARRRAAESALLAGMATSLLAPGAGRRVAQLETEAARVLGASSVRITAGDEPSAPGAHRLTVGDRVVGAMAIEQLDPARRRMLPAVSSLVATALDREQLEQEAVEAEALRRSDALKTALLRSVSHDLRSPLMAILTSSSALSAGEFELDPDDRRELLETITSEAGRLDRLVSDLLDLSRLQAGAASPHAELWPLDDLVAAALDEPGLDAGRVRVELPDPPLAVRVDAGQVQRVLVNLVENALKYSAGPVRVTAKGEGAQATVRVCDAGAGIAAAERERIFQPFQRGSAAVGAERGAGLGLAIARGFAEANGGRLWAEPGDGGATFVLALPAEARVGAGV